MKRFSRFLILGTLVTLMGSLLIPTLAQDVPAEAGQGGTIVEANIGDDPTTFNPITSSDLTSSTVWDWMYPSIIALDDRTLEEAPMASDGMAESWEYDETGTILTLHLRQDLTWSDGTPITADDYLWSYNAIASNQTSSVRTIMYQFADGSTNPGGVVFDVKKIDDFTLEFKIGTPEIDDSGEWTGNVLPSCTALSDVNDVTPVPAHIFGPKFDSDLTSMDADPYFVGPTFGVFTDPFIEFGVQVSLIANQGYPDTAAGYVSPGEWILRQVENTTVSYERFVAGDFTYLSIPANRQGEFRPLIEEKGFQVIEYPQNGYTYMTYNMADPNNPQDGLDESGNHIDQGLHPIFSDVRVRQAFAHAIDLDAIIGVKAEGDQPATGILQGTGYRVLTHNHPGLSWVDPQLEPYSFDPEAAKALLAEAGWKDEDGDGILECHDCMYATEVDPSFNGSPFEFDLLTNAGNVIREQTGETIKQQLAEIGVTVNFQAIEFGTLLDALDAQTYDTIIIGWSLGLPFDPDATAFFGAGQDVVGNCFNCGSYYNPELEQLWKDAVSVPGCAREDRIELYREGMKTLYDDQPYMWLFAQNVMVAAQPNVQGWDPLPYNAAWNLDAWSIND